ncbi:kumamolisin [Nakamurella panacisegetis]|uniref:Kumamolisin n=1 Tax=Nakamurella panacisegetis TaxID=1090615 RepID=A0A1H0RIP2_9ACTN|nr:S53 family peptidase [Nakamurella panacisegetis]SDP29407.1 kumamolisin [Nakamurella panacisegetis]
MGGPLAALLLSSTDLGPAVDANVGAVVSLHRRDRPQVLSAWAGQHGVSVDWHPGDDWASIHGSAAALAQAFRVPVHDYRAHDGQRFYATGESIPVPAEVAGEVSAVGRIMNYRVGAATAGAAGAPAASGSSDGLLSAAQLRTAYDVGPLAAAGYTGQGTTVVFFELDGFSQADLDAFSTANGLPDFTPVLVGGMPGPPAKGGETPMDLEAVHAVAPGARLVVVNLLSFGDGSLAAVMSSAFRSADQQFPGAIWSLSLSDCEGLYTTADLEPLEEELVHAQAHGTSAFASTGDTGSLECRFANNNIAGPPTPPDVGVGMPASLPAMTAVGGTRLTVDVSGRWLGEQAWDYSALSQGSSGGVSGLFPRPSWQQTDGVAAARDQTHRLLPDVSALADPATGLRNVIAGRVSPGGGTSLATPLWAAFTVLMDQYLLAQGGQVLGALNPLLYRVTNGAALPAFHDILLGGNAVDLAGTGYDLVTGIGSPDVWNLSQDLLTVERGGS